MTKSIWFTCCTHFWHSNILKFKDGNGENIRPNISTVEEMNSRLIDGWNAMVNHGDIVYHLGDVVFGNLEAKENFKNKIFPKLKGAKKVLILGNHDDGKFHSTVNWSKIRSEQSLDDYGLFLTHRPQHIDTLWSYRNEKTLINVHGHIHEKDPMEGPYVNVCV